MSSSFKRTSSKPISSISPGVRQGLHGKFLVSTGLNDFDQILGGGLPLGSLILFLEDSYSPHHLMFLRFFMAQGLIHNQPLLFSTPLPKPHLFLSTLPSPETLLDSKSKSSKFNVQDRNENDGLRIAWQYRNFIQNETSLQQRRNQSLNLLSEQEYCSEFNLKKNLDKIYYANNQKVEFFQTIGEHSSIQNLNGSCKSFVDASNQNNEASRMVFLNLFSPEWEYSFKNEGLDLLTWIHCLRGMIKSSKCVAFLTLSSILLENSFLNRILHMMDVVVTIESVNDEDKLKGSGEQTDTLGLLRINKLPSINTQIIKSPSVHVYEIKMNKRKKISLKPMDMVSFDNDDAFDNKKNTSKSVCSTSNGSISILDF